MRGPGGLLPVEALSRDGMGRMKPLEAEEELTSPDIPFRLQLRLGGQSGNRVGEHTR